MVAGATRRLRQARFPARVIVVGGVVAAVVAANAAIGLADDADGRSGTVPGPPDDSAPTVPIDLDEGRGAGSPAAAVESSTRFVESQRTAPAGGLDNGRGGIDPPVAPLPAIATQEAATIDVGTVDTDSGVVPEADADLRRASSAESEPATPVDLDDPGRPTDGPPGDDAPADDQDG